LEYPNNLGVLNSVYFSKLWQLTFKELTHSGILNTLYLTQNARNFLAKKDFEMKNILMHQNNGEPVYVALANDGLFHVIFQTISATSHVTLRAAVNSASAEFIASGTMGIMGWKPVEK